MKRTAMTLLALALAAPADAGIFHRRCRPAACPARVASPAATYPVPVAPQAVQSHAAFLLWLNNARAASGVGPVGWDDSLASMAAANSSAGFAHSAGTNPGRQNVGSGDLGTVSAMWMASPAHASALLDPNIRAVGLANVGGTWTYNGR